MIDSVIINSPILLIGYAIALFFCIFDLFKRSSGYAMPAISIVICLATTSYAFIAGASATEVCIVLLVFLILHLSVFWKKRGDRK